MKNRVFYGSKSTLPRSVFKSKTMAKGSLLTKQTEVATFPALVKKTIKIGKSKSYGNRTPKEFFLKNQIN